MAEDSTMKKTTTREQNGSSTLEPLSIEGFLRERLGSSFEEELRKARAKRQARLTEVAPKIREKYSAKLSDSEVLKIDAALLEREECGKCTGYPCHKKMNEGFIPVVRIDERWGLSIAVMRCEPYEKYSRQVALERKFKQAKIPARYKGKNYSDYEADEENKVALDYAKTVLLEGQGAYFYGDVGTGKTFLSALIAQDYLNAGKTVLFERVADLLTEFYSIYRGKGGDEDSLLNDLYTVDLLILDDFGIEKSTQFVGTTLCKILDARYNRENTTTIITSNYSLKEIKRRLNNPSDASDEDFCLNGSRIYDRCIEMCKPILFKGESRRG